MHSPAWRHRFGAITPHFITATRVALGAAAIIAALDEALQLSATLITLGAVADGLDGHVARWLRVVSPVGALFDYFADYLCFVVAPWTLSRALLAGALDPIRDILLALPLLTGAFRYARNGVLVTALTPDVGNLPGVGTIFYAFIPVLTVFLELATVTGMPTLSLVLPLWIATFAVLMIAPFSYPKLVQVSGTSPVVLVLLTCMPFVGTRAIAGTALAFGLVYIVAAPFSTRAIRACDRK